MSELDEFLKPSHGSLLDGLRDGFMLFAIATAAMVGLPLLLLLAIALIY